MYKHLYTHMKIVSVDAVISFDIVALVYWINANTVVVMKLFTLSTLISVFH